MSHQPSQPTAPAAQVEGYLAANQKYNLVEKQKRKMRSGKKRGPQEQYIFHLKLEEQQKKKKRRQSMSEQEQLEQEQQQLHNYHNDDDNGNPSNSSPSSIDDTQQPPTIPYNNNGNNYHHNQFSNSHPQPLSNNHLQPLSNYQPGTNSHPQSFSNSHPQQSLSNPHPQPFSNSHPQSLPNNQHRLAISNSNSHPVTNSHPNARPHPNQAAPRSSQDLLISAAAAALSPQQLAQLLNAAQSMQLPPSTGFREQRQQQTPMMAEVTGFNLEPYVSPSAETAASMYFHSPTIPQTNSPPLLQPLAQFLVPNSVAAGVELQQSSCFDFASHVQQAMQPPPQQQSSVSSVAHVQQPSSMTQSHLLSSSTTVAQGHLLQQPSPVAHVQQQQSPLIPVHLQQSPPLSHVQQSPPLSQIQQPSPVAHVQQLQPSSSSSYSMMPTQIQRLSSCLGDSITCNSSSDMSDLLNSYCDSEAAHANEQREHYFHVSPNQHQSKLVSRVLAHALSPANAPTPTMVSLIDGCILRANESLCKLLNFQSDVLETLVVPNLVHPDDRTRYNTQIVRMLATSAEFDTLNVRIVNSNGWIIKTQGEISCVKNEHSIPQWLVIRVLKHEFVNEKVANMGEIRNHHCVCQQIKHNRERLLRSDLKIPFNDMFLGVLERLLATLGPSCFHDQESKILWNNDAFDSLFEVTNRGLVGRRIIELESTRGTALDTLTRAVLKDLPEQLEAQVLQGKNIGVAALKCIAQRVSKQDGLLFGYLWLFSIDQTQHCDLTPDEHKKPSQFPDIM